jgi:hypothetical protein
MDYSDIALILVILEGIPFLLSVFCFAKAILKDRNQSIKCNLCNNTFIHVPKNHYCCPKCTASYDVTPAFDILSRRRRTSSAIYMSIGIVSALFAILVGIFIIRFLHVNNIVLFLV